MLVQSLVVLAAVTLTLAANPIPQRPELAPPPREKVPAPWDRRDLLVPGDDFPRRAKMLVYGFLEYTQLKPYQPEAIMKACLPESVKISDIDLARDTEWNVRGGTVQLVTEGRKEAVMMFGGAITPVGERMVTGHLAITVVQVDEYTWRVKGIHFAEGDTIKRMQKLIDAFYDAHPNYRPKKK
jgi:hypothetical protein